MSDLFTRCDGTGQLLAPRENVSGVPNMGTTWRCYGCEACQEPRVPAGADKTRDEFEAALVAWRGLTEEQRRGVYGWLAGVVGAAPEATRLLVAAAAK